MRSLLSREQQLFVAAPEVSHRLSLITQILHCFSFFVQAEGGLRLFARIEFNSRRPSRRLFPKAKAEKGHTEF